jgi:hypothetical protein
MGAIIGAIVSAIVMMLPVAYQEAATSAGTKTMNRLISLGREIYTQIANNQEALSKLQDAYSRKDNDLVTEIMKSTGFGPRSGALKRARNILREEYETKKNQNVKKTAELQNMYNEANQASYNTQTFAGKKRADETADKIEQAINGGSRTLDESKPNPVLNVPGLYKPDPNMA